jgi:hypothetical protein
MIRKHWHLESGQYFLIDILACSSASCKQQLKACSLVSQAQAQGQYTSSGQLNDIVSSSRKRILLASFVSSEDAALPASPSQARLRIWLRRKVSRSRKLAGFCCLIADLHDSSCVLSL